MSVIAMLVVFLSASRPGHCGKQPGPEAQPVPELTALIDELRLTLEATSCGAETLSRGDGDRFQHCIQSGGDLDRVRDAIDRTLESSGASTPRPWSLALRNTDGRKGDWRTYWVSYPRDGVVQTLELQVFIAGKKSMRGKIELSYTLAGSPCISSRAGEPAVPTGSPIRAPSPIAESRVAPEYPEPARIARLEGQVQLQLLVSESGAVAEICVSHSSRRNVGFEPAAMQAVQQWRFEPARVGGSPVPTIVTLPISFHFQ